MSGVTVQMSGVTIQERSHRLRICQASLRLQLHGAIHRPDSFVLMLRHCVNLKAIRYESTSLNRIAADKSHSVIAALRRFIMAEGEKCCKHFVSRFQFPLVSS